MILRLAWLFSLLPAALAAVLSGCIENPGVDPELRPPKRDTRTLQATFRQGKILTLQLQIDSGRVFLDVSNSGLSSFDSATFLIRIMPPHYRTMSIISYLDGLPDLEYYGKTGAMSPGQGRNFGPIGSMEESGFEGRDMHAFLIELYQGGSRKSSPFAGVYNGTHKRFDSTGLASEGLVQGTLNADGAYLLGLYAAGSPSLIGVLDGATRDDGTFADRFHLRNGNSSGKSGGFQSEGKGFRGSFIFDGRTDYYDSIQVRCEPYSPR